MAEQVTPLAPFPFHPDTENRTDAEPKVDARRG